MTEYFFKEYSNLGFLRGSVGKTLLQDTNSNNILNIFTQIIILNLDSDLFLGAKVAHSSVSNVPYSIAYKTRKTMNPMQNVLDNTRVFLMKQL